MKISTKGRYGVRFMLDLVQHFNEDHVSLKDVAKRQEISEKYLWQVIHPLKAAGLISSVRGAHGGYKLARHPEEITIRDIMAVLEGPCALLDCLTSPATCHRGKDCMARIMWREVADKLEQAMASISLADIVKKHKASIESAANNYTI